MKIKQLILVLFGLTCHTSCENKSANISGKTTVVDSTDNHQQDRKSDTNIDQIIFGVYCGECGSHCATMYRYFMSGNQYSFSADFTDSYFKKTEITFDTYFNDKFHFDIGNEIITKIPDILINNDKSSERFGCPDCRDGCGIYFEITKDSKKQKFYIDYQTSELTGDIKAFAEYLKEKVTQLDKKNGY